MARTGQYASDRWVTPGVIIAAILTVGLVVVTVAGGVTYLTARGIDPTPMIDVVAKVATGVDTLGTLLLQLFGRPTHTKTERNTGLIAGAVADLADAAAAAQAPAVAYPAPPPLGDYGDDYPATEAHRLTVPPIPAYQGRRRAEP